MSGKLWGLLQAPGVCSLCLGKAESSSKEEATPETCCVEKTKSPPTPWRSLASLSSEMEQMCPDGTTGPESCHLEGDLGVASGKPDTLAAKFTGLFKEVSRRALLRLALSAAQIAYLSVQRLSAQRGQAGEASLLVSWNLWSDSWFLHHGISKNGQLPAILL